MSQVYSAERTENVRGNASTRPPLRQRAVAWYLIRHPEELHHPSRIAQELGCTSRQVHLALNKLRKRNGKKIDPERLCPLCLKECRFSGVCQACGLDLSDCIPTFQTFHSGARHHEIMDKLQQSLNSRPPIHVRIQTIAFLKGSKKERLAHFCKSKLEQLFKKYNPDHMVTDRASSFADEEVEHHFPEDSIPRIGREDKLAIMMKVLLECKSEAPHLNRMWDEMISELLANPQAFLYDE